MPRRALHAQTAENEFTFAKNTLAQGSGSGLGHVVPLHILDTAAAVADEMVMTHTFRVKPRGAAFDGHFAHQTRQHQVPQVVISRRSGTARIGAIHRLVNLRGGGMPVVFHEERHDGVALRRAPQPAVFERSSDRLGVHEEFRLCLIRYFVKIGKIKAG